MQMSVYYSMLNRLVRVPNQRELSARDKPRVFLLPLRVIKATTHREFACSSLTPKNRLTDGDSILPTP
jgi:hypothetical protein